MKNKRVSTFLCSLLNTGENNIKIKNLSKALRALGIKFRLFRYGRGKNRKAIWQKQVEYSVKTGKGWEGNYQSQHPNNNITKRKFWRPRLMFCERFDVYLEIDSMVKANGEHMRDMRYKMAALEEQLKSVNQ